MRHCRTDYEAIQPVPSDAVSIAEDEPVFVLRSRDQNAADVVRFWANCTERAGGDAHTTARVRRWADEMQAWGEANGTKVPDTPADRLRP